MQTKEMSWEKSMIFVVQFRQIELELMSQKRGKRHTAD
jgi:hypothetical protein